MDVTTFSVPIQTAAITKSYTDFSTAATTNTINLMDLPAQASLVSIKAETKTPFRWDGGGDITLSTTSDWLSYIPLETGVGEVQSKWVDPPYFDSAAAAFTVQSTMEVTGGATWTSGGTLNLAIQLMGGCGVTSAALKFGGHNGAGSLITEEYNGSTWSHGGNLLLAVFSPAAGGTQTAGLCAAGQAASPTYVPTSEEYNGTTWACGGDLSIGRRGPAGAGTQTAGLCSGGNNNAGGDYWFVLTEEYDGATWTHGGDLNVARFYMMGSGTITSGLIVGGENGSGYLNQTEEYDGSSWAAGAALDFVRRTTTAGTVSAGLCFGGYNNAYQVLTESYDGSTWSSGGNMSKARWPAGAGTQASALAFGGNNGSGYNDQTELYSTASDLTELTTGSWEFTIKYLLYT